MIKTKKNLFLCISLITLNVAFIWCNSLLSKELSSAFSNLVGTVISWFFPATQMQGGGAGHGTLRKIAHFMEFCSLGLLLSWLFHMTTQRKWTHYALPLVLGAAVACIDETIQIFVPGRGPGLRDVAIDSAGVLLGVLLLSWLAYRQQKKHEKAEQGGQDG